MSFLNPSDTTSFIDPLDEGAITNARSRARGYLKSQAASDEGRMAQAALAGFAQPIISGYQGTPVQAAQPSQSGGFLSGIGSLLGGALSGAIGGGGGFTQAFSGLGGAGPVASGAAYGTFLDATAGTTGIGPFANGAVYGQFL
tara:strand:+ start:204 stop:632 length:429 start_codon:yes stop_codon:yes gene_type:complete